MLISDLIRVNPAPQVIALGEIGELKRRLHEGPPLAEETEPQLRRLLEQYFIAESDNRQAVEAVLRSLSRDSGEAFLICGPYGSGKSHLLAVISLLADFPFCWQYFLKTHPEFSHFAPPRESKLLVVQIPLDHYGPAHSLEEVVFERIEAELAAPWHKAWKPLAEESYFLDLFESRVLAGREDDWARFLGRREKERGWKQVKADSPAKACELARSFLEKIGLPLAYRRSRAESLFSLSEHLNARGYSGAVLLIDELSTFFASKDKRSLNRDGSFLQFLAQQCETSPLCIAATAQRSLEDVGEIDSHTLRQIQDRFRGRFVLSIAEIRRVLAEKLVEKRDAIDACISNGTRLYFRA